MRRCRFCGCTDNNACVDRWTGGTCAWVADDICSFCVEMDATADFVLYARFCHEMAQPIFEKTYTTYDHQVAATLYAGICAGVISFETEACA